MSTAGRRIPPLAVVADLDALPEPGGTASSPGPAGAYAHTETDEREAYVLSAELVADYLRRRLTTP